MPALTKKPKDNNIRLTLDISPAFYARLEKLSTLVDVKTKTDLIRQALQLYEYMAKKTASGHTFRLVGRDGREENLVFFALPDSTES